MQMDHAYAREKLTQLLRDLPAYTGDEFWRAMSRIAAGSTGAIHAEGLSKKLKDEKTGHSNTLDQRDRAEHAADKLSQSIMGITGRDIGEHSNAHCPWGAAIEHAGEYESRLRSLLIACDTAARRLEAAGLEPDAERFRRALQPWPSSENKEPA